MRSRRRAVTLLGVAVALLVPAVSPQAASAGPQIKGSGSTFAQIAIDQWARDSAAKVNVNVVYAGTGSTAGRSQFVSDTVDWASSDINFPKSDLPVARKFTYLPLVAGGTAFPYKITDAGGNRITDLQLSPQTLARIFLGTTTMFWNDPAIIAENPHLANRLPKGLEVKPVLRAEGSGTTSVLTGYFSRVAPDVWQNFLRSYPEAEIEQTDVVSAFIQKFPDRALGEKVPGSFGVVTRISENTPAANGKIGYAEYGFAKEARIPVARVKNAAGSWTLPEAKAVAIALTKAIRNPDGTQNLADVFTNPDPETYPVSSYNYAIVPTATTGNFDAAKGESLGKFLTYSVTEGQAKAERLGYSPLPCNLIEQSLAATKLIPGAPTDLATSCGIHGDYYKGLDSPPPYVPPPAVAPAGGATPGSGTAPTEGPVGGAGTGANAVRGPGTGTSTGPGTASQVAVGSRGSTASTPGSRASAGPGSPSGSVGALAGEGVAGVAGSDGEAGGVEFGGDPVLAAAVRAQRLADLAQALRISKPGRPSAFPLAVAGIALVALVFAPPATAFAAARRRRGLSLSSPGAAPRATQAGRPPRPD